MSKMSSIPPIPSDSMTYILVRLPVKSLLRFRCVSKSWCAEIDDPYFINLHLTHSLSTGANHSPITKSGKYLYSINSDSLNKLEKTPIPFGSKTEVYNTCRGLLLLQANGRWFIYNSSTRKRTFLPPPPPDSKYDDAAIAQVYCCLGYDIVNDDYKVFLIKKFVDEDYCFVTHEAHVYSLKSNLWHTVKDFTKGINYECEFNAYVNGVLHTVNIMDDTTVLALEVGEEKLQLIPMPLVDKSVKRSGVHVFDGCLAFSCLYHDGRIDTWVRKEYGVKKSWSMLLSVKREYPCRCTVIPIIPDVIPIVYSKSRTEVLLSYDCQKLVWYDLRKNTFRDFQVSGVPKGFGPMVCVESLVSVSSNGKIDDKKKQHGDEKMKEEILNMKRDTS